MAEVHHFAYGWINPVLAYVLSFLGCLLGLILAARSRDASGSSRARWLTLAAIAIGGTGVWLMHFMAMLGFDVTNAVLRYDVGWTVGSLVIAIAVIALGLYAVGFGAPTAWKLLLVGAGTGIGIAAMHYAGMNALHLAGSIDYDPSRVGISVAASVVAGVLALWLAVFVRNGRATIGAAAIMSLAFCGLHYLAMSAIRVELAHVDQKVSGVSPFVLITPISVVACIVISALAYATVGFSVRQENAEEEALLERTRSIYAASLTNPESARRGLATAVGTRSGAGRAAGSGMLTGAGMAAAGSGMAGGGMAGGGMAGSHAGGAGVGPAATIPGVPAPGDTGAFPTGPRPVVAGPRGGRFSS